MSQCYKNSDDVCERSLRMGKGVLCFAIFHCLFWLSLSVRTGWTGFELVPSVQPSVFCVLLNLFLRGCAA